MYFVYNVVKCLQSMIFGTTSDITLLLLILLQPNVHIGFRNRHLVICPSDYKPKVHRHLESREIGLKIKSDWN